MKLTATAEKNFLAAFAASADLRDFAKSKDASLFAKNYACEMTEITERVMTGAFVGLLSDEAIGNNLVDELKTAIAAH